MSPLLWLAVQAMALSQPLVVAHRGLSAGMPENTLPAFRHALDIGADAIELDLRPTADGQPVVIHDPTVDRTTNGTGTVSAMTLRQIQALDAGSKAGPGFAGERVPSYADVLTQLGPTRARLVIDIKTSRNMSLADIIRLTREHGMVDRVIVAVRTLEDLRRIKALEPRIQTLALIPTPITIDAFADAGADVIRLWSDWIDGDLASPVAPPAQGLIAAVRARGRKLWILVGRSVPPDGAKLRSLLQSLAIAPVDGVMTDAPEVLIDIERATRAGKSSCPATGSPVPASVGC